MCLSTAVNAQLALQVNMSQQKIRESNSQILTGVGSPMHIPMQTPLNQNVYPGMQGFPPYMGTPIVPPPSYLHAVQQSAFTPLHLVQPQSITYPNPYNIPTYGIPVPLSYVNNMGQPMGPSSLARTGPTILPGIPHPPRAPIPFQHEQTYVNRTGNAMHRVLHDGNAIQVIGMCHAVPGLVSTQHPGHVKQQNIGNKNSSIHKQTVSRLCIL